MQHGGKRHNEFHGQDGQEMQNEQKRKEEQNKPVMRSDFIALWMALNDIVEASKLIAVQARAQEARIMTLEDEIKLLRNEIEGLKSLCNGVK